MDQEHNSTSRIQFTIQGPVNSADPARISLETITVNSGLSQSQVSGRCFRNMAIHLESHKRRMGPVNPVDLVRIAVKTITGTSGSTRSYASRRRREEDTQRSCLIYVVDISSGNLIFTGTAGPCNGFR